MELARLKITATVITARYGALSPGDMLNTDLAFAKHLVNDCKAARFVEAATEKNVEDPAKKTKGKSKNEKK